MGAKPTIHITASDANRNGKTLLARLLADYLLLDQRDPFLIDTDAPDAPLRSYFPGRTTLADFDKTRGQMRVFDTIFAAPGRDYIVDLPLRHVGPFFKAFNELNVAGEARKLGFRIFVFFIVDRTAASLRAAQELEQAVAADHFTYVRNDHVGSVLPVDAKALHLLALPRALAIAISDKRFSLSEFVRGEAQGLSESEAATLRRFLVSVLDGINLIDSEFTLTKLGGR